MPDHEVDKTTTDTHVGGQNPNVSVLFCPAEVAIPAGDILIPTAKDPRDRWNGREGGATRKEPG